MPVRQILQLGDPALRRPALPHDFSASAGAELPVLISDLRDTLAHWRQRTGYGRGIAAPQLGVSKRVIFLELPGCAPWPFVNPQITGHSAEKIVVWDACLSFLAIFMQVERYKEITIRYQDPDGGPTRSTRRRRTRPVGTPAARNRSSRRNLVHRSGQGPQ